MNPQLFPVKIKTKGTEKIFDFVIENYPRPSTEDFLRTAKFPHSGHKWNLKIQTDKTSSNLNLFLELNNASKFLKVQTHFSLAVLDRKAEKHICKERVAEFGIDYGNCWGWEEFTTADMLKNESFGYLLSDRLLIRLKFIKVQTLFYSLIQNVTMWRWSHAISTEFTYGSCRWFLKIYPEGTGKARGSNMSVFLANKNTEQEFNPKISYRVTLVDQTNPANNASKLITEYGHEFEKDTDWGWKDFMNLDNLTKSEFGYLKNDSLLFIVEMIAFSSVFKFEIEQFSIWGDRNIEKMFTFNGCKWLLHVWPEGNGVNKNKSLSVYLAMKDFSYKDLKCKIMYKVILIDQADDRHNMEVDDVHKVGSDSSKWGWPNYLSLEELKNSERGYLRDNKLVLKVEIFYADVLFDTLEYQVRVGGDEAVKALRESFKTSRLKKIQLKKIIEGNTQELEKEKRRVKFLSEKLKKLREIPKKFGQVKSILVQVDSVISESGFGDDEILDPEDGIDGVLADVECGNDATRDIRGEQGIVHKTVD